MTSLYMIKLLGQDARNSPLSRLDWYVRADTVLIKWRQVDKDCRARPLNHVFVSVLVNLVSTQTVL